MDKQELLEKIAFNVVQGRVEAEDEGFDPGLEGQPAVTELVEQALEQGIDPKEIVLASLTESMEQVGEKFERNEYLIPDMLASAECVGAAMDILSPHLMKAGVESKGKFVIATVSGDLHDIGKNIVAIMLKGAGYNIIDLGTDVSPERIVQAVKEHQAPYVGLSALLTTTMRVMGEVVSKLKEEGLRDQVKVLVGGAPLSDQFAKEIGADAYCKDAFHAIDSLKSMAA
ncbi:corrinoid protein [Desulfoferrobacter suflitae]|uniref:corrinoid protein n=1 Tax=Desulfoferrobacter suflitae TaxID=2865782 RepID=UPI002164833C|nr:corrinoid protein [Desulfoferrobacter suflitae]MCK8601001.1 corrinoid protein [Desulfoferrobacter suflitae]